MGEHSLKQPKLLTKKEVATLLRCSTKTVYRRIKLGLIKTNKLGGTILINPDENPAIKKAL